MPTEQAKQREFKLQQDQIYRDRILRARAMTMAERFEEVVDQSEVQIQMMLAGAMHRIGTTDEAEGWREVQRWTERLDARQRMTQQLAGTPVGS